MKSTERVDRRCSAIMFRDGQILLLLCATEVGAVSLLPHEQFMLRQIERRLTEADPALAAYLSGRVRWRWLAAVAVIYTVPAVLLGLGVGAHLVAVLVAARCSPRSRHG